MLFLRAGNVHAHDTRTMENHTATAGNHALYRFTGFGVFLERLIIHRLNHFKAFGLLAFFLRFGLVDVGWH